MDFGEEIRDMRRKKGISQKILSRKVGISYTYLSKIENGVMPPPSEKIIEKMAVVLETEVNKLKIKANKIPSDYEQFILENPESIEFIEKLKEKKYSKILWQKALTIFEEQNISSEYEELINFVIANPDIKDFLVLIKNKKMTYKRWKYFYSVIK